MSNAHTPGPWTVNGGDDVWIGQRVCIHVGDEDDANLIAAAPDLLSALQAMILSDLEAIKDAELVGIPFTPVMLGAHNKALAAIAKATGASNG